MTALRCEHVEHSYGAESTPVLAIDAFELLEAEQCGIRGRSGTGKTTFLNALGGILVPTKGRIVVGDHEISALPEARRDRIRARHVGYVFQSFHLLPALTAIENVLAAQLFAGDVDRERAHALLERLELASFANRRPRELSVGQQQRVALARALANDPTVVLADEPTASLDTESAKNAVQLLAEVCSERNSALLVVSHDDRVLDEIERIVDFSELNAASGAVKR